MAKKYEQIAALLRTRIHHGDYALQEIPPERRLAVEVNASYMTVRRAIQRLVDDGFLVRQANGRAAVNPTRGDGNRRLLQLAFLAPSYPSPHAQRLRLAAEKAARRFDAALRPVEYVHWDDPIVRDTINGFDGVFLVPLAEDIPERLEDWLAQERPAVVVIDQNLSGRGVPSLMPIAKEAVQQVLDHLASLGHRRIDCLSTQPRDSVIAERIEQWRVWRQSHGIDGRLIHEPVNVMESPRTRAREVVTQWLGDPGPRASAVLCTNLGAAIGAGRALADRGLAAGKDVSICTVDGEGLAEHLTPSITCVDMPDLAPYLAACIEWMARGGRNWIGPLLIRAAQYPLFIGESTRPPSAAAEIPARGADRPRSAASFSS